MLELAWAAGLFEGEGTAMAFTQKWVGRDGKTHFGHTISKRLAVYNNDHVLLEVFQKSVGNVGSIGVHQTGHNRATSFHYQVTSKNANTVAASILPYVVSKYKHGQLVQLVGETPRKSKTHEEELAWAAGIFEGEGTAGIYQRKRGGKPKAAISIYNTQKDMIAEVLRIIGFGHMYTRQRKPEWSPEHSYYVSSNDANVVSTRLLPHVKSQYKRSQLSSITNAFHQS